MVQELKEFPELEKVQEEEEDKEKEQAEEEQAELWRTALRIVLESHPAHRAPLPDLPEARALDDDGHLPLLRHPLHIHRQVPLPSQTPTLVSV